MTRKKKPKASKALAVIPRVEPSLQALARDFEEFIRGVQEQELVNMQSGSAEEAKTLAKTALNGSIERRDNLAELLRRMESEADYLREQGKQRYDAARHLDHLKDKALFALQLYFEMEGIKEVQGFAYRFKLQKNPPSVFILDPQRIPEEYMSYEPKPDKQRILEALKEGKEVPGAVLRDVSYRLEIK